MSSFSSRSCANYNTIDFSSKIFDHTSLMKKKINLQNLTNLQSNAICTSIKNFKVTDIVLPCSSVFKISIKKNITLNSILTK